MNFSQTRCTQRDTMLWRRPKRALRLVRFWTGRGLAARWEWRWWIASHCAVNGVRDWLRTHRIHGRAPNKSKQDPRLKVASLTRRGSEHSAELLEFPHLFFISLRRNSVLLLAQEPAADSSWYPVYQHALKRQIIQYKQPQNSGVYFSCLFWKKIQMELDRYFWQSCDWQLSFVPGHFEHGFRSVNFGQNCCISKARLYDLGSKTKGV